MATPQQIVVAGTADAPEPEEVRLILGGLQFRGWTSVRVTSGIERCPNDFELGLTERQPDNTRSMTIAPGQPIEVSIGRDVVLVGYVDRQDIDLSTGRHDVRISGRGKCQDLVDCSALWPQQVITNSTVLQVAQRLAQPFNIDVVGRGDTPVGSGTLLPYVVVPIGETAWSVIERLCAVAGLLAYETRTGELYVGPGPVTDDTTAQIALQQGIPTGRAKLAASGFAEGVNVISARASFANDQRYSVYQSHRMSVEKHRDVNGDTSTLVASATDGGVERYRPLAYVAEGPQEPTYQNAQDLARWEAARRWGRSRVVQLTTDSWRDADGALYEPGTLVRLDLPSLKVVGVQWLISEVTFIKDEGGTRAELLLMRPEAFQLRPTLPPYLLPPDQAALPINLAQP